MKLDNYNYHEILHTASLATDFFAENLADHVAVLANKELRDKAEEIVSELYSFYNLCGHYCDKKDRAQSYELIDE